MIDDLKGTLVTLHLTPHSWRSRAAQTPGMHTFRFRHAWTPHDSLQKAAAYKTLSFDGYTRCIMSAINTSAEAIPPISNPAFRHYGRAQVSLER